MHYFAKKQAASHSDDGLDPGGVEGNFFWHRHTFLNEGPTSVALGDPRGSKIVRQFLSGIPESNRCCYLGRVLYYHYTNPAFAICFVYETLAVPSIRICPKDHPTFFYKLRHIVDATVGLQEKIEAGGSYSQDN